MEHTKSLSTSTHVQTATVRNLPTGLRNTVSQFWLARDCDKLNDGDATEI
jgi:hypothetical protein